MRTINKILAVTAAVAVAGVTGCSAQSGPSASSATASPPAAAASSAPGEAAITIRNFGYEVPASVRPGSMVTVMNADSAPHTLTAKDKGGFDVEVQAGATVTFAAPEEPGEYGIVCTFHPQMAGTLVVK